MSYMKFREEVLNVSLAEILRNYGLAANPEIITSSKLPDVRIVIGGLKVILEGKTKVARKALEKQARNRLESGLADISIAIHYPKGLNEAENIDKLKNKMRDAQYSGVVYYWSSIGISSIRLDGKTVTDLVEVINRVFTLYIENDLLRKKIEEVEVGITKLTEEGPKSSLLFYYANAIESKLRKALGISEDNGEEEEE